MDMVESKEKKYILLLTQIWDCDKQLFGVQFRFASGVAVDMFWQTLIWVVWSVSYRRLLASGFSHLKN